MDTYSPAISFGSVRILLYIALCFNKNMTQMHLNNAFLSGILNEDIWVISPRGVDERQAQFCKRNKEIYGLKSGTLVLAQATLRESV